MGAKFVWDGVKAIIDGTKVKNPAKTLTKKNKLGEGNDNALVEKFMPDLDSKYVREIRIDQSGT